MSDTIIVENIELKCCKKCKKDKILKDYSLNRPTCNRCYYETQKNNERRLLNKEVTTQEAQNKKPNTRFKTTEDRDKFNENRRLKYKENEELRKKICQQSSDYKNNNKIKKDLLRQKEQEKIGLDNKICNYCNKIQHKTKFRHNRLKCKDCERDEPLDKIKRTIRGRIHYAYKAYNLKKNKNTVEYLGCDSKQYFYYLLNYNPEYNLNNYGKEWHIDHVIPLSKFDLNDEENKSIAFNWRNTMPLSKKENLAKNNKIIKQQLVQHYNKLLEYHQTNNIEIPQTFIDLFAKHLDDGDVLRAFTTTL